MLCKGVALQSLVFNEQDKSNHFPALIQAITQYLDFKRWGFDYEIFHSGSSFSFSSAIIFQSEFCKVRVWTFRDIRDNEAEIYYAYGRLHAPNEKHTIKFDKWGGREYTCWHDHLNLYLVLGFLDGLSAEEVAKREFPYFPDVLLKFNEEAIGWGRQERFARQQNTIWNQYGQRLFGFYDLRTPNMWNQYIDFVKDFRSLKEKKEPPYDSFYETAYPTDIY